ncbi:MAG: FHA domain-containing protein [Verrucomicrobiales bacterium]|nr:FHA domain-containing protein [Verrucomicrobiales bacterium]
MAKLVVLGEGQNSRSHELQAERTTVGRLDDNALQFPEQSVSSHHCEIILRGNEVVVRDLNSTNGTFINGEQITEKVLKPGQILRLGKIEMRLENGQGPGAPVKSIGQTRVLPPGGVKFDQSAGTPVFDKNSPFAKKSNKTAVIFITIGAILFTVIVIALIYAFSSFR